MFFFFEQLMLKYKQAIERWEKDGEKWVANGVRDGYSWRDMRDYRRHYPSPTDIIKKVLTTIAYIIVGLVVAGFFVAVINNSIEAENKQREQAYAGHSCKAHEMGDRVKVQYGDWKGVTGVIVGGCGHNEDYQIKLDKQLYSVANDGNNDPVEVEGRLLGVDTYRNIIKIEK